MGQVKVWNTGDHELKERFNGREISIMPKKFIVMESDEANNYRGQYYPMVRTADGHVDPRFHKKLKIEPIGEETSKKLSTLICHVCTYQGDDEQDLDGHLLAAHSDLHLKDDSVKEKRPRAKATTV